MCRNSYATHGVLLLRPVNPMNRAGSNSKGCLDQPPSHGSKSVCVLGLETVRTLRPSMVCGAGVCLSISGVSLYICPGLLV